MPELKQEQIKIINHQSGNILVSASAGSGKTFVMIERVIRLITENKAKVSEILAVTFTEAAATEMKERLKKALSDKINDGREDLSFQLNDVASSDISTMHSFCARLIRLYFFVAGVSPDFKIIDAVEATNLKNRSIAKVMREKYTENSEQFNTFLDKFIKKRSDASLRETVLSLYEFANVEADPESIYDLYKNSYTVDGYIKLCSEYKDFLDKELSLLKQSALCVYEGFKSLKLNKSAEFCLSMIDDIDLVLNGDLYCIKQFESYAKRLSFESGLSGDALDFKMRATEIRDR
ncbi:MAG: UvrD-helicase domain-containing protein, partial [Clostridia bacterium]|nr:UvrD-helicase domain-containing protein [Clostridia bacterium]